MMEKEELLKLIRRADKAYYEDSAPILSDAEYDVLRRQFIDTYGTAELDYVPTDVAMSDADFVHPYEVISLGKVKAGDEAAMRAWLEKTEGTVTFLPVHLQKKEDGCTVVSYKIDGRLLVVTRGDGKLGKVLSNLPARYASAPFTADFPIRSEAIFTKSDYEAIQQEREAAGLEPFKNIRNAVSGVIQSKEKSPYLDRVTFVAYDVLGSPMTVTEKNAYIKEHTNYTPVTDVYCETEAEVLEAVPRLFAKWDKEDHPIDGVVVKSDARDALSVFGTTGHHPLHSFAYKAEQEGFATVLRSIEWQVGREKITAVAHFDPVEIDGTTVARASVANMGIIRDKGLSLGAKILVIKSNQIIPFVERVLEPGDTPIAAPTHCPSCGQPLVEENDVLFCVNEKCRARLIQNADYLGSKKVLNIKGLSESTLEKLVAADKLRIPFDILKLKAEDFLALEGFKEKSAQNLAASIEGSKQGVELSRFVAACCIPHIGASVGEILAESFPTWEALNAALADETHDFSTLEGIGEVTNGLLHSEAFRQAFAELHAYIEPVGKASTPSAGGASYTFVITGKLSKPRSHYEALIKAAGSKVTGSVSKNTDYLLCEDENSESTKAKKARALGITVISEDQLEAILSGAKQEKPPVS